MKNTTLLFLCTGGMLLPLLGRSENVTGKVTDKNDNALKSAVVALMKSDSTLIKTALSDNEGNYSFENISEGQYLLMISAQGHVTDARKFDIEAGEKKELRSFELETAAKGNEEVHPLLVTFPGKMMLDVEGNGVKVQGTAWEVLKTLPDVTENEEGLLICNGRGNFAMQFDGKTNSLTGNALKNRIKQIKAEEISGIEIDTDGGLTINIITREGAREGFYGKAEAGGEYGNNFRTADAFEFNYHKGGFDFYGRYDFSEKKTREETFLQEDFMFDGTKFNYTSNSVEVKDPVDHNALAGIEYNGDHGLAFGAEVTKENIRETGNEVEQSLYTVNEVDTALLYGNQYSSLTNDKIKSMDFHLDKTFKGTGTKFSAAYSTVTDHNSWNQTFPVENDREEKLYRFAGGTDMRVNRTTFKYAQAWNSKLVTVAGVKQTTSNSTSGFTIEKLENENWVNTNFMTEAYASKQKINSAFLITYLDFGKINIAAAIDAQQSTVSGMTGDGLNADIKTPVQFIPSVSIDQTLNKNNAINYSFSQDIKRPSFRDMDPTSQYVNRYTYFTGNPNLRPQITNEASVKYTFLQIFSVEGGIDFTQNGIQQVSRVDSNGIIYHTKENITKERNESIKLSCPLPIGKHILMENQFNWEFSNYQSEVYGMTINSVNHHFTAVSALEVEIPSILTLNVSGYYVSPTSNGIVSTKSTGAVNLSVSKEMMDNKLEVELGVTDIFNTGNTSATILTQDGLVNYKSKSETQTLTLKASYAFGNQKSARKE